MAASEGQRGRRSDMLNILCAMWKKRTERRNVGVSARSRNGAPSQKGCVVNGQTTEVSNE